MSQMYLFLRLWGPHGLLKKKNIIKVTGRRGSVAAVSAISNDGRLLFSLHDSGKRFNSDDIIDFLDQMLSHHLRRHLVVVMDQAPCHTSKKVKEYIDSKKGFMFFTCLHTHHSLTLMKKLGII